MIPEEKRWFKITFEAHFFGMINDVKENESDLLMYINQIFTNLRDRVKDTVIEGSLHNHLSIHKIQIEEQPDMYKLRVI